MVRAVVVQLAASDPPGRLARWLPAAGLELDVVRPFAGDPVPDSPGGALVVLGGEMSAYDDDRAPWLIPTRRLLAAAVAGSVPTLGVCLGAQLLAVATGGRVRLDDPAGPEIGVGEVGLLPAADGDALLGGLPPRVPVFQWHFDGVAEPPPGAVVLAASGGYPVQAFRIGSAWGVQWHPEMTAEMATSWAADDADVLARTGPEPGALLAAFDARQPEVTAVARELAERFAAVAAAVPGTGPARE